MKRAASTQVLASCSPRPVNGSRILARSSSQDVCRAYPDRTPRIPPMMLAARRQTPVRQKPPLRHGCGASMSTEEARPTVGSARRPPIPHMKSSFSHESSVSSDNARPTDGSVTLPLPKLKGSFGHEYITTPDHVVNSAGFEAQLAVGSAKIPIPKLKGSFGHECTASPDHTANPFGFEAHSARAAIHGNRVLKTCQSAPKIITQKTCFANSGALSFRGHLEERAGCSRSFVPNARPPHTHRQMTSQQMSNWLPPKCSSISHQSGGSACITKTVTRPFIRPLPLCRIQRMSQASCTPASPPPSEPCSCRVTTTSAESHHVATAASKLHASNLCVSPEKFDTIDCQATYLGQECSTPTHGYCNNQFDPSISTRLSETPDRTHFSTSSGQTFSPGAKTPDSSVQGSCVVRPQRWSKGHSPGFPLSSPDTPERRTNVSPVFPLVCSGESDGGQLCDTKLGFGTIETLPRIFSLPSGECRGSCDSNVTQPLERWLVKNGAQTPSRVEDLRIWQAT